MSQKIGVAIWIIGSLGGVGLGFMFPNKDSLYFYEATKTFNLFLALATWIFAFLLGSFYYCLGEITEQLKEIHNTLKRNK